MSRTYLITNFVCSTVTGLAFLYNAYYGETHLMIFWAVLHFSYKLDPIIRGAAK